MADNSSVDGILDFASKKKKKNKSAQLDTGKTDDVADKTEVLDFKKKKKIKEPTVDSNARIANDVNEKGSAQASEAVSELADALNDELSFGERKKKKRPKPADINAVSSVETNASARPIIKDSSGYDYETLLSRVYTQMSDLNPELLSEQKRKLSVVPPQLARVGTKKISLVNFAAICRSLNRDHNHVTSFIVSELGTQGSVDAKGALLMRGRYTCKQIEVVLRNYCRTYVLCTTCQSSETDLCKDSRLLFLQCRRCGSRFSVKAVAAGMQSMTAKRAALRAKIQ